MTACAPRVRPFPWESLDVVTRAEAAALRDARRWLARHARPDAFAGAFKDLLDAEVELRIGRIQPASARPTGADDIAVLVGAAEGGAHPILIETEKALAVRVVARALKRPPPAVVNGDVEPPSRISGAFAAVLASVFRKAHAEIATRILRAGSLRETSAPSLACLGPEPWSVSVTVLLENDAFAARIVMSPDAILSSPTTPWDAAALAALGPTPLLVPIVIGSTRIPRTDLVSLRSGDAILPRPGGMERIWPLPWGRTSEPSVWLSPASSEIGVRGRLAPDGRLVLTGEVDSLVDVEAPMEPDANAALVSVLADAPVVVRVEIGEAQMSAREWATIGRGDVVPLGRRVGEPVILRVAGVPMARGELVQIDGEVAVRIVERLLAEGAPP